ncbi:DUF4394 domain-containing protein [Streptosporangium sp. NPDC023615]|uniref:DUF4394 domain-containing protein n=1 Tax=Streptosporangium sp. NPDC023615 TaxID=3154794 RepID=UPI00342587D4
MAFDARFPARLRDLGPIRGLEDDTEIIGIDYRVRDGQLYGVGNAGGVYTLTRSATATTAARVSQLTVAPSGSAFDADFDPVTDVLRVVSNTGQNLRHDLEGLGAAPGLQAVTRPGRTVADKPLSTPPFPPPTAPATVATPPAAPSTSTAALGFLGAAHTNNDLSPVTATALFAVDTVTDRLSLQSPADIGALIPVGDLRVAATGPVGFDVHSSLRGGVTVSNSAFATLKVADRYGLYGLDLLTGAVNHHYGTFPAHRRVVDIAVQLNRG